MPTETKADTERSEVAPSIVKRVIFILVVVGLCIPAALLILGTAQNTLVHDAVFYSILIKHYPATIGLTISALAAVALVFLLEYAKGPIEFQGLGFKFKGAAGPLVFWIACFLVINLSIATLWKSEFHSPIADKALDALVSDQLLNSRIKQVGELCVQEAKLRGQKGDEPEVKKQCAERIGSLIKKNPE